MPDTTVPVTETEVSQNTAGPVITTKRESTEVLDPQGHTLGGDTPLSRIFEKVASGEDVGSAVKDVMQPATKPEAEPKPEKSERQETVTSSHPAEDKQEEVVVEPKKEKKEEAITTPPKEEEQVSEDDLQVLPHDKPKTAVRIRTLLQKIDAEREVATTTKKELEAKNKRLADLEAELNTVKSADPLTNEKVKGVLEELGMYRRRYDLENDPALKERYDGRIANAETTIQKNLADNGLPEPLVKIIAEEGGWLKFVDSNRPITLANGKTVTAAELAENIRAALPRAQQRQIEALELEQIQLKRDRDLFVSEESKKAKDYFSKYEENRKQFEQAQQQRFEEAAKTVKQWREKFAAENEWLREKEVGANLTKEQKAALEDHNTRAKQLNSLIDKHLAAKDINQMLEVLVDAVQYHEERHKLANALDENKRLKAQLQASEERFQSFKKAGSATPKTGSLSAGLHSQEKQDAKKPQTLEEAFEGLAAAKASE